MINLIKPEPKFRNGYKDKKHRDKVRALTCIACKMTQKTPTEAHHLIGYGIGRKPTDLFMIPLCNFHHTGSFYPHYLKAGNAIHETPLDSWERVFGIQEVLLEKTYEQLKMYKEWEEVKLYINPK